MKRELKLRTLILTSLFISGAVILRFFSVMLPVFGANVMRISFDGIFIKMPALLFGPLLGGITAGIVDLLAYIIKPTGGFIPFLTLTSILGGVITGLIWNKIKDKEVINIQRGYFKFFIFLGILNLLVQSSVLFFKKSKLTLLINSFGKKTSLILGLLNMILLMFLVIFIIHILLKKTRKTQYINSNYIKIVVSVGLSRIFVTTINTYILMIFIPGLLGKGFILLLIPRLIQAIFMILIESYILSLILSLYKVFQYKLQH